MSLARTFRRIHVLVVVMAVGAGTLPAAAGAAVLGPEAAAGIAVASINPAIPATSFDMT